MADEKEIRDAFDSFDKDGSGRISTGEIRELLISIGVELSDAQADQLIRAFDKNNSGQMEFDEFRQLVQEAIQHSS